MNTLPESESRSQCAVILRLLLAAPDEWVSMVELGVAAGGWAVHSRIADLRAKGYGIENKVEQRGAGKVSYYRLTPHKEENEKTQ